MNKEDLYLKSVNHDVITIYIAKGSPIQKTIDLLKREEPLVQNIKSRVTRQAIEQAFQKIKSFLANPPTSENGYIIVASADHFAWTKEISITKDLYRCGNEFYSIPLEEVIMMNLNPIGILAVDSSEATLAYVSNGIEILAHLTSGIAGKHGKGGQSQRRFEREREQELLMFYTRIGEAAKVYVNIKPITALLVGGPGETKNKFLESKYLDYRLKEKLLPSFNIQYTSEDGIREILHLALPKLEKNAYAQEVREVNDAWEVFGKQFEKFIYGKEEVQKNIHSISKIIKIQENKEEYPIKTIILRFPGEHYDKIKGLGGVIGIRY